LDQGLGQARVSVLFSIRGRIGGVPQSNCVAVIGG